MAKIVYAAYLGLSPGSLVQFSYEKCVATQNRKKFTKIFILGV